MSTRGAFHFKRRNHQAIEKSKQAGKSRISIILILSEQGNEKGAIVSHMKRLVLHLVDSHPIKSVRVTAIKLILAAPKPRRHRKPPRF